MVYHFWNLETFEYLGSVEVKPGRIPGNGTTKPLPNLAGVGESNIDNPSPQGEGKIVWDNDKWVVKSKKEFTEHLISLGLKSKSESEKITQDGEIVTMSRTELIEAGVVPREQIVSEKLAEISRKAKAKIEGGFRSKAKSAQWYIYDSELEDQFNMQTLVMSGVDSAYRCTKESDGVKDFYPHTNAQLALIVTEFTQFKVSILQKAQLFRDSINALESASEIDSMLINF
ncbi:MAG: hypothetical protein IPL26_19565 [Leptospiraceae bacterium]|nr:hypothetical protein [Leptospiraceae bacterium]